MRATDLPVGSVIATGERVAIKKRGYVWDDPRDEYWMFAEGYAIPYTDQAAQTFLDEGAEILRVGPGTMV